MAPWRNPQNRAAVRDLVLLGLGAYGFVVEVNARGLGERPLVWAGIAGCLGLPWALGSRGGNGVR